jgi:flavin reductase (DIM6/NTAB) family NADH-FMN oxidoreductase RutF
MLKIRNVIHICEVVVRKAAEESCRIHDTNDVERHVLINAEVERVALYEKVRNIYSSNHEGVRYSTSLF